MRPQASPLSRATTVLLTAFAWLAVTVQPAGAEPLTLPVEALGLKGDYSIKTQILLFMTLLGLLPTLVIVTTSFLRFAIVLALLRQALGLQQGLPARVITGVALLLTLLVMRPVGVDVWQHAIEPYDRDEITFREAVSRAEKPLSRFMLAQTSKASLEQISRLSGERDIDKPEDHAFIVKAAAFMLSELKTAFQIGAMLFLPFLIIDLVVASTLMAMGMMMLSPLVISLPLKLLLFVLVDGWTLTVNTLSTSIQAY
ncbi:flagellar biosynthesis protein flip [Burkholderia diffusa]|uniref:Flagellar biosynthetic protein FliP n=1 Tax=Burkholderia diffusa TaxID=488732 RepID=A0AAW3P8Z9_9BURK|nr:flagellar type III secretion system pore protein FliP [Burkholderia diffusa]KVH43245.1 flagellar biosynthesis protein flip [Burkholderia diffusa]KVN02965.1 flagellar biosynthesis protein flip [Burkholderia diffusa]KWF41365.1 flagellar biosynthesis protein flip [Burkholderia diffusa]KWF44192.1 flagellar biosynthesis protein flip [Burkholderia diffusa]KWF45099.1 flagellar biosynthesis protein flip [Burkholderia diffusa]